MDTDTKIVVGIVSFAVIALITLVVSCSLTEERVVENFTASSSIIDARCLKSRSGIGIGINPSTGGLETSVGGPGFGIGLGSGQGVIQVVTFDGDRCRRVALKLKVDDRALMFTARMLSSEAEGIVTPGHHIVHYTKTTVTNVIENYVRYDLVSVEWERRGRDDETIR